LHAHSDSRYVFGLNSIQAQKRALLSEFVANVFSYWNSHINSFSSQLFSDRIEAGTWAIAAAMTGGELLLKMDPRTGREIMVPIYEKLQQAGVSLSWTHQGLEVKRRGQILPVNVTTGPFPKFPTDLLPLWVTFMTLANGPSILHDTIYDSRFNHVPHLENMGAKFTKFSDQQYQVHGNANLSGTRVVATDLRAGAALILAALVAEGTTVVKEFQHVLRGYENIKEKLSHGWSVRFTGLPQTRPGFHGGQRH
jgi:UDP-N-acetylglucosamine 1-carboxyvinyltransferase